MAATAVVLFSISPLSASPNSGAAVTDTHTSVRVTAAVAPDSTSAPGGADRPVLPERVGVRADPPRVAGAEPDKRPGGSLAERRMAASPLVTQRLRHGVQERRSAAWKHADWLGVARAKTAYRERHTRSTAYLKWLRHRWAVRAHRLWTLRARTLRDFAFAPGADAWPKAVREVQRVFGGTEDWLLSCSAAEGGHGRWVGYGGQGYSTWLRDSDTVGGPLQFRYSTFTGMFRRAVDHAYAHGFRVPIFVDFTAAWRSALGQALAGGWARYTGNDDSHWSASWSRGC